MNRDFVFRNRLSRPLHHIAAFAAAACLALAQTPAAAQSSPDEIIHEASIAKLHAAIAAGEITCTEIIEAYLRRIDAFNGPCGVPGPDPRTLVPGYTGTSFDGYYAPLRSDPTRLTVYGNYTLTNDKNIAALLAVNVRGERSGTCPGDCDVAPGATLPESCPAVCAVSSSLPDALEEAVAFDAEYGSSPPFDEMPLYCIPFSSKDTIDSSQIRSTGGGDAVYANDRAEEDATVIARIRAKGAILLGQANVNEYNAGIGGSASVPNLVVGHNGSLIAGPICNPYDNLRSPGSSSGGSGASVGANLVVCSFCEETGGSCRNPANVNGAAVFMGTHGFVSKFGLSPVSWIRDRIGIICRSMDDVAKVVDAVKGYDPRGSDSAVDFFNPKPESFTALLESRADLSGLRLGIVREHMVPWIANDQDRIDKFNAELQVLRDLGAELVESVDPEYIARMGDDPTIPNMVTDFNDAIAEVLPYYAASYIFKTNNSGSPLFPTLFDYSSDRVKTSVDLFFGDLALPAAVADGHLNLRRLQSFSSTPGEGKFALNVYLGQRGDALVTDVDVLIANSNFHTDLLLDPNDPFSVDPNWPSADRSRFLDAAAAQDMDSVGLNDRLKMRDVFRQVIGKVMGDNDIDAFINPLSTLPTSRLQRPGVSSAPGLRPSTRFPLSSDAGIPEIVVPMGFSNVVYDPFWEVNPNNSEAVVTVTPAEPEILPGIGLPFGMAFWAGPGQEALLIEISEVYEDATNHRLPPEGYGPLSPL